MPDQNLVQYGRAVCGAGFVVPPFARWRPPAAAERHLRQLQRSAVRVVEAHSEILADDEAAHGLEQQLIDALVECLSQGEAILVAGEHQEIAIRFEALLKPEPQLYLPMAEICTALGVSAHGLRIACEEQLGMRPTEYVRRRRMQLAHRVLRNGKAQGANVSAVARRFGFRDLGNFAANYRALYGELPSATLQRGSAGRYRTPWAGPRVKL
jgi:AraC family ethanolamine operon transcriptional activator